MSAPHANGLPFPRLRHVNAADASPTLQPMGCENSERQDRAAFSLAEMRPGYGLAGHFLSENTAAPRLVLGPPGQFWFAGTAVWPPQGGMTATPMSVAPPGSAFLTPSVPAHAPPPAPVNLPIPLPPTTPSPTLPSAPQPPPATPPPRPPTTRPSRPPRKSLLGDCRRRPPVKKLKGLMPRPPLPKPLRTASGTWYIACPVPEHLCGFVQHSPRRCDMRRHLDAHFPKKYRCVGLPVDEMPQGLFRALPRYLREVRSVGGTEYVGGCGNQYGRMDSLMRHIDMGRCVADREYTPRAGHGDN